MKTTLEKDRIRLQAQTAEESTAIAAIADLVFHFPDPIHVSESLANDFGCEVVDGISLNFVAIPYPMTSADSAGRCAASHCEN